jgi:hypothetical protein
VSERKDLRDTADRLRKQVYESGGPKAVKAAEQHIQRTIRELDQKQK